MQKLLAMVAGLVLFGAQAEAITLHRTWLNDGARITLDVVGEDVDGDGWLTFDYLNPGLDTISNAVATAFKPLAYLYCNYDDENLCWLRNAFQRFDSPEKILIKNDLSEFSVSFWGGGLTYIGIGESSAYAEINAPLPKWDYHTVYLRMPTGPQPVPLPPALPILASALGLLVVRRRRAIS